MKKSGFITSLMTVLGKDKMMIILVCLAVIIGFSLMDDSWNESKSIASSSNEINKDIMSETNNVGMEEALEKIIRGIEGVGNVRVMITYYDEGERIVMENREDNVNEVNGGVEKRSVSEAVMCDVDGDKYPYVISERKPKVDGVAVVCDGAKNIQVKQKIINIIQALFSIEVNKISVTN